MRHFLNDISSATYFFRIVKVQEVFFFLESAANLVEAEMKNFGSLKLKSRLEICILKQRFEKKDG